MKMKRYFWLMAAAVLGLVACQNKLEEVRLVDPSQVVAPVLHELPSEIVITAENMSETVKFEWDKADFGQPVQYSYSLYGSTDGGQTLVKIYSNMTDTSIEVPYESFNQVVTTAAEKGGLGLVAGEAAVVKGDTAQGADETDCSAGCTAGSFLLQGFVAFKVTIRYV